VHDGAAFGHRCQSITLLNLALPNFHPRRIDASCKATGAYANCSRVSGASSSEYLRSDYGSYTQAKEQLEGERVQSVGAFNCCPPKPKVAMR
jgi:hypothetical protein